MIGASRSSLGLTAGNNLVKGPLTGPADGRIYSITVTTAGAAGAVYDSPTTAAIGPSNLIFTIPAVVGVYNFADGFPFGSGLVVSPGAGQVVSVSFR